MGKQDSVLTYTASRASRLASLDVVRRRKPRAYEEWKALYEWRELPPWEGTATGYLLRLARERAHLTQKALAQRLRCSQPAVAQAERWSSNPTVGFLRRWAKACGTELTLDWARASRK